MFDSESGVSPSSESTIAKFPSLFSKLKLADQAQLSHEHSYEVMKLGSMQPLSTYHIPLSSAGCFSGGFCMSWRIVMTSVRFTTTPWPEKFQMRQSFLVPVVFWSI